MNPINIYLNHDILPMGRNERRQFLRKSPYYTIQDGVLYRCGFSNPMLRCLAGKEAKDILHNTHQGSYGDNTGGHWQKSYCDMDISDQPLTKML